MADLGARPILPQGSRSFAFANQSEPREKQKNYVFVDEHNRHRRLKVMRACGACRRRKIKCDAATTNSWPCAACLKQNLECVPPSSDNDGQDDDASFDSRQPDYQPYQTGFEPGPAAYAVAQYPQASGPAAGYDYQLNMQSNLDVLPANTQPEAWQLQIPNPAAFTQPDLPETYVAQPTPSTARQSDFPSNLQDPPRSASAKSETPDGELANALQDLRIDQAGVAPYIANQRVLAEGPAVEEAEAILPPSASTNQTVGIPPEMMPSEQQATQYIEYFFANIHPYVPVVNRTYFYQQWQRNHYSISPLILEGIFACSANTLQRYEDRNRWLALASRHEESFKDVPRLSTIQGLMLLLKARESTPKRGYYYRSWTTIQYLISMAKDLELDVHNWAHIRGEPCDEFDCAVKTRIWHTLFCYEMMIGGPQGRYDFSIDLDSVMTNAAQIFQGVDESELRIAQDQIHMVRIVKNIRQTSGIYARLRGKVANFAENPDFVRHNTDYYNWTEALPRHLQITFNADGSAPWIPFHFAANLHSYHLVGVILHHRPQLNVHSGPYDNSWKQIMVTCYSAATRICRLHEAIINRYGLNGFICMARGINTAIYSVLACTVLHLVAITSPDVELNANAKDYFTRHMRILEQCAPLWPMPSLQLQINSLREAFSADLTKSFELKANFPYGTPPASEVSSPPNTRTSQQWQAYDNAPLTPPDSNSAGDFPANQRFAGAEPVTPYMQTSPVAHQPQAIDAAATWDPSSVFDRWNAAFNAPVSDSPSPGLATAQPTSVAAAQTSSPSMYHEQQIGYASYSQQPVQSPRYPTHMPQAQSGYIQPPPQQTAAAANYPVPAPAAQPYVTPSMWQEAVAKSYGDGVKRRWNDDHTGESSYKRMR